METMIQEFFTWEMLATAGGATLVVTLITQLLKGFLPESVPAKLTAYVSAVFVLVAANIFTSTEVTAASIVMCLLNAMVVALAANGAYDAVNRKSGANLIFADIMEGIPVEEATVETGTTFMGVEGGANKKQKKDAKK